MFVVGNSTNQDTEQLNVNLHSDWHAARIEASGFLRF